jgi:DDE superfamily endonuclease.
MEAWFDGSDDLPPNTMIGTSPNGWISDELANQWLDYFIKATRDRTNRGKKRVIIFDGHGSHLTLEFLQTCEDHDILPFGFIAYSTHLCQPLDGKPFLSYKQHFRSLNNDISYWTGEPMGKAEFLCVIGPIRSKAFNQRIICESFKDRGIYPVDASKILSNLSSGWADLPDLITPPKLRPYGTPSPPPANLSSSRSGYENSGRKCTVKSYHQCLPKRVMYQSKQRG